jgi:hypothetical protein
MYFIIAIFIILFIYACSSANEQKKKDKDDGIILRTLGGKYLGGFNDIEGGKNAGCVLYDNRIQIHFSSKNYKTINISNINNIGIKSDVQIQNDVTLNRLLAVGVLAFGLKKKQTIVNNYLVINYNNDNKEENIILQTNRNEDIVKKISSLI